MIKAMMNMEKHERNSHSSLPLKLNPNNRTPKKVIVVNGIQHCLTNAKNPNKGQQLTSHLTTNLYKELLVANMMKSTVVTSQPAIAMA